MRRSLHLLLSLALAVTAQAEPLRVFIRAGKKSHGPNQHEHERFLADWKVLLAERGIKVDGALDWPTAEQFRAADVVVVHAQSGGDATEEQKAQIAEFTRRGGGLVVLHAAVVASDPAWWKSVIGGTWVPKVTQWKEGPMNLYLTENQRLDGGHPITQGASNFHLDDEIYYDLDLAPEIRVLATAYTPKVREGKKAAEGGKAHIYDIQPQMWAYEKGGARAFVSIPGHLYDTFAKPNYRAILLRGIAWAGHRANVDEFTRPGELEALRYPPGGPQKPADTLANLEVHPDFTIKLVASEPLISKPMNFDWDAAGRLWVAETPEYPNGRRGMRPDYRGKEWKDHGGLDPAIAEGKTTRGGDGKERSEPGTQDRKGRDKISILTDSDGDGVMDKKHVFYEGLDLVTGLVFHRDGVIVTQAPDILFLRDTDADGTADKVEKLFTGLGTRDTHAVINNPRWGWDGWIYATHGYSSSSVVKNARGEPMPTIGSGVVRFRPDGSVIEQYSSKGGNTWGLAITADNRVLWTQPTSGTLLNETVLPEYALARGKIGNTASHHTIIGAQKTFPAFAHEALPYVQIDRVGDFTAAAGCAIYDGGAWPAEYNGDYFTTEPTLNIIAHQRLTPAGSSSSAHKLPGREETEFIRSKDAWWRPIEVRIGPDGSLFVADFYNQAVIHNDTRGPDHNAVNAAIRPDRDHYFGRIWKIEHKLQTKLAVPVLTKAGVRELAKALESPNRAVRMTASRLLVEGAASKPAAFPETTPKTADIVWTNFKNGKAESKIAALWTLANLNSVSQEQLLTAMSHGWETVRRNAALIFEAGVSERPSGVELTALIDDNDRSVRLAALRALAVRGIIYNDAEMIAAFWPEFDDDFQRSAAIAAASRDPVAVISAALNHGTSASSAAHLAPLVSTLAEKISAADVAASLVVTAARKSAEADVLKQTILEGLAKSSKDAPPMTPELSAALRKLLASGASGSALPLAVKWDKAGALQPELARLTEQMTGTLADGKASQAARIAAAQSLLGIRGTDAKILPAVISQLDAKADPTFQRQLILALAEVDDAAVGKQLAAVLGNLPVGPQTVAFDALLKRADWTNALLDTLATQPANLNAEQASNPQANASRLAVLLAPANAFRLRSHPDKTVAARATTLLDQLNPQTKAKKDAIAKLISAVEQKGDAAKGKTVFTAACAICHEFGGAGAKIGPALTGMGTHGAGELLTAIVDPNAEVEPSFLAYNFESKDGQLFNGVIESENPTTVTLKSLAGVQQIKIGELKRRENTGRSLMPEGFEGLGAESLRDLIAYMQSVDGGKFRALDLRAAFTASTANGLYKSLDTKNDTLTFAKTGTVNVEGVPFHIVAPEKAPRNIVVLKGGPPQSYSHTLPTRVEIAAGGFRANRIHFLGGISGWGAKSAKENGAPVLKVAVRFADGATEELVLRDGVEFADYIGPFDVPGSRATAGLVTGKQLRWFTKPLARTGEIASLALESLDSGSAPTLVAITAELADGSGAAASAAASGAGAPPARSVTTLAAPAGGAPAPLAAGGTTAPYPAAFTPQFSDAIPQPPAARPANGPRVLLVGGGASHDFPKFFGTADKATLAPHVGWIDFTQNANGVAPILDRVDVLVWSANQPISAETRAALLSYVNAGKGLIAYHPGTWYAWPNFPEWNAQIVGGGARGHDKLGEFEVAITHPAHPIMAGVPPSFRITDELYHLIPDKNGTPLEVLAAATSTQKPGVYPQVFVVKHARAKIVGLTLGHDARAHDLPAFQTILRNAVAWAAEK